jgi:hypothetical protein
MRLMVVGLVLARGVVEVHLELFLNPPADIMKGECGVRVLRAERLCRRNWVISRAAVASNNRMAESNEATMMLGRLLTWFLKRVDWG